MRYRFVEVIGCAGSGKSSVIQHICHHEAGNISGIPQDYYNKAFRRTYFLRLPLLVFLLSTGVRRHYLKTLLRVESSVLAMRNINNTDRNGKSENIIWLDQGPIFQLAYLLKKKEHLKGITQNWFYYLVNQLKDVEDIIFWLDAPNSVLLSRINARQQNHRLKNAKDISQSEEFFSLYRNAFSNLFSEVNECIPQEYVRTENITPQELAIKLIRKLNDV